MGIEKDIQQNSFRNAFQKVMINVLYTHTWLAEHVKQFLAKEDITPQQYNILRILRGSKEPLSTLQIRARMLDKMSDTSRIVERMVAKQLVCKKANPLDKRLVAVTIAEQGLAVLERLDAINHELDSVVSNQLSEQECEQLSNLLDKMRGNNTKRRLVS